MSKFITPFEDGEVVVIGAAEEAAVDVLLQSVFSGPEDKFGGFSDRLLIRQGPVPIRFMPLSFVARL